MLAPADETAKDPAQDKAPLRALQAALGQRQRRVIERGERVLVILEGRDAAGKAGCIRRMAQHLSPRDTRVVALGKPSAGEPGGGSFQRHLLHLPAAGEIVFFNRSWYSRADVERVLHGCSHRESEAFLQAVVPFETLLVHEGLRLLKYYLDIRKDEQRERLRARRHDPLHAWRRSLTDAEAVRRWDEHTRARDALLEASHSEAAPWTIVQADDPRAARLNLMRDLLARLGGPGSRDLAQAVDPAVVFRFRAEHLHDGRLTR